MAKLKLVVSIHDFSPKYIGELEEILKELGNKGYGKRTILAIPNLENSFPLRGNEKSIELLHKEFESRNEICLHGYSHSREQDVGEFENISYANAISKIGLGKSELWNIGIPVKYIKGFVPPNWKISQEGESAVRYEKFIFIAKNPEIKDLRNNKIYNSRPIWFWPYSKPLDYAFRLFDAFLARFLLRSNDLARVAIHPQDLQNAKPFDYALKLIEYLSKERELSSYEEFLELRRREKSAIVGNRLLNIVL